MSVDGSLNFDTNVNTKGFSKGIDGIKNKLGDVKSAVSKFGSAITAAFSAAAIVSFGKSAIESAAEINASNSQMEQTFGGLYSSADEAMKRVAETSGIVQTRASGRWYINLCFCENHRNGQFFCPEDDGRGFASHCRQCSLL